MHYAANKSAIDVNKKMYLSVGHNYMYIHVQISCFRLMKTPCMSSYKTKREQKRKAGRIIISTSTLS